MIPEYELCDPILRNTHFQYVFNNNLTIVGAPNTDILQIPWFDEDLQNIIRCLGFEWTRYFNIETYRGAFDRMSL